MSVFVNCVSLDTLNFYEYDALYGDSRGFMGAGEKYSIDGEMRLKWLIACWSLWDLAPLMRKIQVFYTKKFPPRNFELF